MKGKTNQPLVIVVADAFFNHPEVESLANQGHKVYRWSGVGADVPEPDLILHPAAHFYNETMADYLPAAITAARKRKREKR
jgi:hypothetical protein